MTSANTPTLPTISALRRLEPRPGGQWTVTGQSSNSFALAYILDGGADGICYTMHSCTTEEDVRNHCGSLIYRYSARDSVVEKTRFTVSKDNIEALNLVLRPKDYDGYNTIGTTDMSEVLTDPLTMNNSFFDIQHVPKSENFQSQFAITQTETPNMFDISLRSSNGQDQQQLQASINESMNWPTSDNTTSEITPINHVSAGQCQVIHDNEKNEIMAGLWDNGFGRIQPLMTASSSEQTEWSLPFTSS